MTREPGRVPDVRFKVSTFILAQSDKLRGMGQRPMWGEWSLPNSLVSLLSSLVRSLRELFRPTSHLFAVWQQELLRHGFRNHNDSPECGLYQYSALTRSRTKTPRPQPAGARDNPVAWLKSTRPIRPDAALRPPPLSDVPYSAAVVHRA